MSDLEEGLRSLLRERERDVPGDLEVLARVRRRSRQLRRRRTALVAGLLGAVAVVAALVPALVRPGLPGARPASPGHHTRPKPASYGVDSLALGPVQAVRGAWLTWVPAELPLSAVRFWLVRRVVSDAMLSTPAGYHQTPVDVGVDTVAWVLTGPRGQRCSFAYIPRGRGVVVCVPASFSRLSDYNVASLAVGIVPAGGATITAHNPRLVRIRPGDPARVAS